MNCILFGPEEDREHLRAPDSRFLHVRDVLKAGPGSLLKVGILRWGLSSARVLSIDRRGCRLEWLSPGDALLRPAEPPLRAVNLILGHPRPPVLSRLLRDSASWGLGRVIVTDTALTERSYRKSRVWDEVAVHTAFLLGLQQGGLVDPPELLHVDALAAAIAACAGIGVRLVLREPTAGEPSESGLPQEVSWAPGEPAVLAVGPERGFTDPEAGLLRREGFTAVSLGPTVLRTEVAVHAALGLLSGQDQRWTRGARM